MGGAHNDQSLVDVLVVVLELDLPVEGVGVFDCAEALELLEEL